VAWRVVMRKMEKREMVRRKRKDPAGLIGRSER
jgi:hypothetical protein